ncbi:hypothetical protein BKA82DRAFT_997908 [Pisolithus tinctorius]|uniref:VLRF1 domain-containing protein n=1 Tax=Pisolithus tinctorius Marx 270 TaxID=870435 RepID=A0A0C3JFB1_PISTI|nr:hypothetical protein BKA82DRAFT_997908 [Pisolithus tinctorius]KIO07763.1 hypothetical protein M404DRAFT_997908 [Pisolithus tinctorius Marx 270]
MSQRFHVFSLPPDLLDTLTPRNLITNRTPKREPSPPPVTAKEQASTGARTCNVCLGAAFADVDEQRSHFHSDWHRYNVKIRLKGGNPVSESVFAQLVEGLEDSLSGSASDDESAEESDAVDTLVTRVRRNVLSDNPEEGTPKVPISAVIWFHSPPATQIGTYRMLFPLETPPSAYLSELKEMQTPIEGGRKWAMFMVAGGHFAGAIVRVSRAAEEEALAPVNARKKPPKPKPETLVIKHKTFHRYTTRRKQGGSQSINDNAKGAAISAGAILRRYGEQALRDDIRSLLQDWAEDIHDCERIWIRASVSNRRIFLDYEGCVINKGDDRLRTFPFPTRRPTQSELSRCLLELTQVKISHFTEEDLRAQDEAFLASLPRPKPQPTPVSTADIEKPKPQRLTKEEEIYREKWSRLLDMITKGRLDPLKSFWEREAESIGGVNVAIPEWIGDRRASLLQVAAQSGHEEIVRWLLYDLRADPTVSVSARWTKADDAGGDSDTSDVPSSRRTAYDLARSRAVRDVLRRCAADHPDWWDWFGAARVPSGLSKEKEEERDDKRKQRRKGLKERMRERDEMLRSKAAEEASEVTTPEPLETHQESRGGPQRLGGSSGRADGIIGLTSEMRAKVERERRARAAEARLALLSGQARR